MLAAVIETQIYNKTYRENGYFLSKNAVIRIAVRLKRSQYVLKTSFSDNLHRYLCQKNTKLSSA